MFTLKHEAIIAYKLNVYSTSYKTRWSGRLKQKLDIAVDWFGVASSPPRTHVIT